MLSIIIPTYNEQEYLPILLKCLKTQTYKDFEIIVADFNSRDKTRAISEEFGALVVEGGTPAIGRNNGALAAKGDLYLFLDADVNFHDTFLEEIIAEFYKRELDIASCYVAKGVENRIAKAAYYIGDFSTKVRQYTKSPTGPGACILVKKEVHLANNGFDISKVFYEDWDYIKRAVKKHYKYRVLHNELYISTRRFDNNSLIKIAAAAVSGTLLLAISAKSISRVAQLYGGWGTHDNQKPKKKFFSKFR